MRGKTAEDMLNVFSWKLAPLIQIAATADELWQDTNPHHRWRLGMTPDAAHYVFDLREEYDEMRERIIRLEDRDWRPEEATDA